MKHLLVRCKLAMSMTKQSKKLKQHTWRYWNHLKHYCTFSRYPCIYISILIHFCVIDSSFVCFSSSVRRWIWQKRNKPHLRLLLAVECLFAILNHSDIYTYSFMDLFALCLIFPNHYWAVLSNFTTIILEGWWLRLLLLLFYKVWTYYIAIHALAIYCLICFNGIFFCHWSWDLRPVTFVFSLFSVFLVLRTINSELRTENWEHWEREGRREAIHHPCQSASHAVYRLLNRIVDHGGPCGTDRDTRPMAQMHWARATRDNHAAMATR